MRSDLPPFAFGDPYAVVAETGGSGRAALIRAGQPFFDRISGRAGKEFVLKACTDLMQGFEAVHCGGKPMLRAIPGGKADIAVRIEEMDIAAAERIAGRVRACGRGPRTEFVMRGRRLEECGRGLWGVCAGNREIGVRRRSRHQFIAFSQRPFL